MKVGASLTLVLGGARSGKSDLVVRLAHGWPGSVAFAATATAGDDDMAARIDRHRADRPAGWHLIEQPMFAVEHVDAVDDASLLVIDCLTMLVANLVFADIEADAIVAHVDGLAQRCAARGAPTLLVSNEVGMGVHPETALGRRYRDLLGLANRAVAKHAETSLLVVAGRALPLETVELSW